MLDLPLSVASVRSGLLGVAGAVASMVMGRGSDTGEVFPAGSVWVAMTVQKPSDWVLAVSVILPVKSAMPVSTSTPLNCREIRFVQATPPIRKEGVVS